MLRVVLDTNVFVSSLLVKVGIPAQVMDAWRDRRYVLVISPAIIAEMRSALNYPRIRRKYNITDEDVAGLIVLIQHDALLVPGEADVAGAIPADPTDKRFLRAPLMAGPIWSSAVTSTCSIWCNTRGSQFWNARQFLERLAAWRKETMNYRKLGRTGLKVSELCLGTMQFGWTADEATSFAVWTRSSRPAATSSTLPNLFPLGRRQPRRRLRADHRTVDEGARRPGRDRAGNQGPRPDVGRAERRRTEPRPSDPRVRGLAAPARHRAHRPLPDTLVRRRHADRRDDPPLDDLVRVGKVRYFGCSNYPAWRLAKALWASDKLGLARYDSLQPHYNLAHRAEFERELKPLCEEEGVGVIPYSPLAGGFLTGKYRRDSFRPAPAPTASSSAT